MTREFLLMLLAAMPSVSAVIRGNVVENFSGKLLSRAVVTLEAMPGTPGGVRTVRTNRLGSFEFDKLDSGVYVLKASRRGFMPAEHGQKRWNSAGQPIVIDEAASAFVVIRLPRFGAISGTAVDENEIGLPGIEVAVYRKSEPPELIREATADDRGVYRVGGLIPGKYFVRTVGKQYEDGGYLPTFSRETVRPEEAQSVETFVEQQIDRIDVRPLPGRVYRLDVGTEPTDEEVTLTLASAMGRKTVVTSGYRFTGLPPGEYEVYAQTQTRAAYQRLSLNSDSSVSLLWSPGGGVTVSGSPPRNPGILRMRRKDLAGTGPELRFPANEAPVHAGRWEVLLEPPPGFYAANVVPYVRGRLDGWIEILGRPRFSMMYRLAAGPGSVRGVVKDAPYAPVYLEAYDSGQRKRAGDLRVARADARGQYRFENLAPGSYRVLSTFEYASPDTDVFDIAGSVPLTVTAQTDVVKDLDLWVIR
jgi:hypothetical protein